MRQIAQKKSKRAQTSVLMAIGMFTLMAVVFWGIRNLVKSSVEAQAARRQHTHWAMFVAALRSQLTDPVYCTAALNGQSIQLGLNQKSNILINMNYGNVAGPIGPAFIDSTKQVKVANIQLEILSASRARFVRLATPGGAPLTPVWPAQIVFSSASKNPPENLDRPAYKIELFVTLNPPTPGAVTGLATIVNCYGAKSEAAVCEQIGGAFDANPTPIYNIGTVPRRCHPYRTCFYGNTGVVTNPASCNPPTGPGLPYSARQISYLSGVNQYLCDWCNPNVPSGGDPKP